MLEKLDDLYFLVGAKLKTVAKISFILGCVASLIWGILVFDDWHNMWVYSILIWVLGPLTSYVSSMFIYGFAQIVESCESIESTSRKLVNINKVVESIATIQKQEV